MDKVDSTMNAVNEQRELANEIAETLANPIYAGVDVDEVRLPIFIFPSCFSPHIISSSSYHLIRMHVRTCNDIQQDELKAELDELQQDELNNRLNEADHVPVHLPPGSVRAPEESEFRFF